MRFARSVPALIALSAAGLVACGGSDTGSSTTSTTSSTSTTTATGGGGSGGSSAGPACTDPVDVACADNVILQMNFQSTPVGAQITNTADGAGYSSGIDATAGGFGAPKPTSYTYGKFTAQGLQKVDISDEDSLTSMDWDIAFRRYVIRINSGDSGPSCVQAARAPATTKYEDLSAVPDGLTYHDDDTFTAAPDCTIIPDGTGLPDSPATALSGYYTYGGCVQMSHRTFVVALADGQHVKLTVDAYYGAAGVQEQCDSTGSVPMSSTGSANYTVRWAYLP